MNDTFSFTENSSYTPLLSWSKVEKKVSWGVIILLGGGFAIAKASQASNAPLVPAFPCVLSFIHHDIENYCI